MLFLIAFNDKWLISFVLSREILKKQLKAVLLIASAMLHSAVWFQNLVQAQLWVEFEAWRLKEIFKAYNKYSSCHRIRLLSKDSAGPI